MLEDVKLKLEKYNQGHLLNFYNQLSDEERNHLLNQINSIDFDLLNNLFKSIGKKEETPVITSMISFEPVEEYKEIGLNCVKNNEYAVVTMAGGQGTRLGYDGPKGTYMLGYGINKSLFEIQCDKLKSIYVKTNVYVPWYIMTSKSNNQATIDFFEQNNYFDYPKDKISFFTQDELPMIDINGKIIMDSMFNIKMGSNGNGGVFSTLYNSGVLNKMKNEGIKYVFLGGIDNILTPYDSFELVGFAKKEKFLCASYIISKAYPEEKVGVFCKKNGKPSVIEYIHMTPEMNNLRDEKGNLVYGDAHILLNLFSIEALEILQNKKLKYAEAFKKTDYVDEDGKTIAPEKENAYKFEAFIFEAFPILGSVGLLKGRREDIFAPIKNKEGLDSPDTASKLYIDFYRR